MKMNLFRRLLPGIAGLALLAGFAATAPSAQAFGIGINVGGPVVIPPPPQPVYYPPGPAYAGPGPGAVWIDGHYEWDGARWVWYPGYWSYPPAPGGVWVGGGFYFHDGHRYWHGGHWR